jgi:hypothetical protein
MAGLVYAHDLSIADRLVLRNLENDIVQHSDEKRVSEADSESDTNGSSTSSLVEADSSGTLKRREAGFAKPDGAGSLGTSAMPPPLFDTGWLADITTLKMHATSPS